MVLFSTLSPKLLSLLSGKGTWKEAMDNIYENKDPLFEFGTREWTVDDVKLEIIMGFFVTVPCAFLVGRLLLRMTCTKISYVRVDLMHAILSTITGDMILELLLPSFKCLPTPTMFSTYDVEWLRTMWGLDCYIRYHNDVLTPKSLFILLAVRTVFIVIGLSLGQGFHPIAITGGIATGKSTIVRYLTTSEEEDDEDVLVQTDIKEESKQGEETKQGDDNNHSDKTKLPKDNDETSSEYYEDAMVSIYLVDCDKIGHEILLSPGKLKEGGKGYSVLPKESVYNAVIKSFQGHEIQDEEGEIDRKKLGSLIFAHSEKRKVLNALTHSRIAWILLKRLLWGCFISGNDLVVAEVPLLYESKSFFLRWLFCLTIMVTVESPKVQLQRLQSRNPELSEQECQHRLESQMPLDLKAKRANYVLHNGADRKQVVADLRLIQQACLDHLYGVGITATQIVSIVVLTLIGGLSYQFYQRENQQVAV